MANNRLHKYDAGAHARKLREKAENKRIEPVTKKPVSTEAVPAPVETPKINPYRKLLDKLDRDNAQK